MPHRLAPAAILLVLSFGCSTHRDEDRYYWQYDPDAKFGTYRLYAVEKNLEPFFDTREKAVGADLRRAIEAEIDKQMAAKGFTRAQAGRQADFVVRYYGGIDQTALLVRRGPSGRDVGRGQDPGDVPYVPMPASARADRPAERKEDRLVVEIVNPRTGQGLWRATVEEAIPQPGAAEAEQRVRTAVAGALQQFPPK